MRVLLVSANTERLNMVALPVGLGSVAAAARRAGHEVSFLDLLAHADVRAAVRERLLATRPEAIGISVRNIDDQCLDNPRLLLEQVRGVIEECRAGAPAPIVLGGAGYSIFPDAVLAYLGADCGVCGDGEVVFPALLERLARGEDPAGLPGVHVAGRAGAVEPAWPADLDELPVADDAFLGAADPAQPELWVPVQSRRGCPNDCSYCSTFRVQGRTIRVRSPRIVVEHIGKMAAAGFSRFWFVDNSFNIPETHARELCRGLQALTPHVVWRCILYPHRVREDLVREMAAAGCVEVALGFESGSPAELEQMNKRFTPDDVREIAALLAAHRIRRMGFLLLGGPGETRESVEESLAFAESLGLEQLRVTVGIRIYPGTPLARRAVAEGLVADDDDLLRPRFYVAPGLGPWLRERVKPGIFVR